MDTDLLVYLLYVDVDSSCMYLSLDDEEQDVMKYLGRKLPEKWSLPEHILEPDSLPIRDFVEGDDFIFVSQFAYDCLKELLQEDVEFRRIGQLRGIDYYLMNVLRIVDCLDQKSSMLSDEEKTGLKHVSSCYFHKNKVPDAPIFKIPQDPEHIFVTKPFIRCVVENQISGVGFADPSVPIIGAREPSFEGLPILKKEI